MSDPSQNSEVNPDDDYARWKFAGYAAMFFDQARKEGELQKYFRLVEEIYRDRWPEQVDEDVLAKVSFKDIRQPPTPDLAKVV